MMTTNQKAPLLGTAPSCTSFYTDTKEQSTYKSLHTILHHHCSNLHVRQVIMDIFVACEQITQLLQSQLVYVSGTTNEFGDVQLSVDILADEILWNIAKSSHVIHQATSEEDPILRNVRSDDDSNDDTTNNTNIGFTVCWDPLDGSSIVDNNWAVGTIIGVWPSSISLLGSTGRDQVTSIVAMYGPRTTILVALDDGTYEFTYVGSTTITTTTTNRNNNTDADHDRKDTDHDESINEVPTKWICSREKIMIRPDQCRIFSPANLRATQDLVTYSSLVNYYISERYTLRYTGGLVPDVYQQFTKHQGIYMNPTSDRSPAKLRITFEAAPLGLLVEKAGGTTSDGITGTSILDVTIESIDQRTALCLGSQSEVDRYHTMMKIK